MTQIAIQAQVDAIKKVTQEALKSKETALKFLVDAGIVQEDSSSKQSTPQKEEKKK
jgi:hypothetical protein